MHDEHAESGYHPLDLVMAQKKRISELEAENATLAAHQCTGGEGDESGNWLCCCQMMRASKVFDLLVLARNSKDEDALQEAIDILAPAARKS